MEVIPTGHLHRPYLGKGVSGLRSRLSLLKQQRSLMLVWMDTCWVTCVFGQSSCFVWAQTQGQAQRRTEINISPSRSRPSDRTGMQWDQDHDMNTEPRGRSISEKTERPLTPRAGLALGSGPWCSRCTPTIINMRTSKALLLRLFFPSAREASFPFAGWDSQHVSTDRAQVRRNRALSAVWPFIGCLASLCFEQPLAGVYSPQRDFLVQS